MPRLNNSMRVTPIRRAMTLVEVLIATTMLGALLVSLYAFSTNLLESRAAVRERTNRHLAATTLFERIESDLSTCLVGDARSGAGVRGDATNLRILSRGVAAHLAADPATAVAAFGDMQETVIRFSASSGEVEARRTAVGAVAATADGSFWPMGTLGDVRFRFHDGRAWLESFDSLEQGRLPAAIEVAVWFNPPRRSQHGSNASPMDADRDDDFDDWPVDDWPVDDFDLDHFDAAPLPPPDRIRVIAIPDPDPASDAGVEFEAGGDVW